MSNDWYTASGHPMNLQDGEVVRVDPTQASSFTIPETTRLIKVAISSSHVTSGMRDGDDLVLTLANGQTLRIVDYFDDAADVPVLQFTDGAATFDSLLGLLSLAGLFAASDQSDGGAQGVDAPQVTSFGPAGLAGTGEPGATVTLLDADGNPVLVGGAPVTAIVAPNGTWQIPASSFPGGTTANFDGSVVATDAGGNRSDIVDLPITDINGNVVLGPIVPGNGLVVDLYDGEGNLLLEGVALDAVGNFSVTLPGTHPVVVAVLRDENIDPDYRDEVSGNPTDLDATLMALGNGQTNGLTTTVQLNINPVTTIAAQTAGLTSSQGGAPTFPAGGITAALAIAANTAVAEAFGLTDLQGPAPIDIFDPAFNDADGNVSDAEAYGQVLAMLSGLDQLNGGDVAQTIADMTALIANNDTTGVRDSLVAGAAQFEFSNPGGTEDEANLLTSPVFDLDDTPEVEPNTGAPTDPEVIGLIEDILNDLGEDAPTLAELQSILSASDAVQALAALEQGAAVPTDIAADLTEATFTAIGLTGLTAPSPYLADFLDAIAAASNNGAGTDTVEELQALLDAVIAANLPAPVIEQSGGDVVVGLPNNDDARTATVEYTDAAGNPQTLALVRDPATDTWAPVTAPLPAGFALVGNDLTIANGTLEGGSDVTVTVADAAGNEADASLTGVDNTAPPAPTVAQSGGDVVVGLPNNDDARTATVEYTDAAGNPQTLELVRDPATDTWAPVTAPLPAGFALVGNDLTIANGTLEGGSDVTVTVADAAGNEADASLTGVDNTAPPAPTVAQSGGDVVVGLPNNDDARTATVEYTDAAGNPQTLALVRDPATDTWAPVTAPLPAGFALVGNDLTIANGTLEGGSDVTVTVADAAGNAADASLTGVDNTAPPAPTVAQSGGDVVVGLPNNDDARTASVEYTDAAGNPQTLELVRDPATDTWAPVTAPLPAGFTLVGNDLTIANGTLEGGSDVTVTVADAAGNEADASLTGVDNTAPPAASLAQSGGDVVVGLPNNDDARTATVEYTDAAGNPQTLELVRDPATDTWAPVTAPLPAGFALVGNDLTIANGTLEGGSDVTVTVADAAGNEADASLTGVDNTAPPAASVAQSGGDVVVGLPNNDDARTATVEYTDAAGNPQTLALVRDPATDTWAPVTAPLPAGFALVGNDLTIANGTLEGGSDVTVTVADAAGNEADASLTGVDNTAPPAASVAQSGGDVVVGLPNNDDARTATVEYTDAAGNPQTLALVRDPATDTWAPVTAPLPAGFALVGNDLTIANGTLEGGSDVTVTVADAAGNEADASLTGVDNTAPPAASVAQSGGDVVVGLPNNDDARTATVEYTDAAGNPQTLALVRDPATDTWAPVTAPLPAGFTLVGNDLTIANGTLEGGSDVTVTVADAAGNAADASLTGVDNTAPPAPTVAQSGGDVVVGLPNNDDARTATVEYTDAAGNPQTLALVRDPATDTWAPVTAPLPAGFALVGNDLTIANGTLEGGSDVTVTVADAAGNEADASLTGVDNTAPPAPTVAQSGGDVVVGLPNNDDARTATVEYTDAAGNPQTLELVRDPATDTWAPVTAPLPAGFALVGNDLTIANGTLEGGSDVTVTVADAAGNEADASLTGVDNTAPPAPTVAQSGGDVVVGLPNNDDARTATVEYTDAAGNPQTLALVRDPATDTWAPVTAPLPAGFALVGNDLTIANGTLEGGSDVTVTVADAAGNAADASLTGVDNTAPPAPTVAQSGGDVVVGLPNNDDARTASVEYTDAAGNPQTLELVRDPATDTWAPVTAPLPAGFTLVGNDLTIANGTLEGGSDVTVTVADAAGNEADASLTGVDNTAPPAASVAQSGGDVVVGLPNNDDARTATVEYTDAAGNPQTLELVRDPATDTWAPVTAPLPAGFALVGNDLTIANGTLEGGSDVTVTVADAAGNEADASLTGVDNTAPPAPTVAQSGGDVVVGLPNNDDARTATVEYTDAAGNPQTLELVRDPATDTWAPVTAPLPAGFALVGNDLTIANGTLEGGSDVTVTVADAAGNEADASLTGVDNTAPPAPTVAQSGGDVVVGLPNNDDARTATVEYTDAAGNPQTLALVRDPATDTWAPVTAPLPAGFALVGNDLTIANGTLEGGSDVTVTVADAAGNEADASLTGVDNTAPPAPTVAQSGGDVVVGLPNNDDARTATVEYTDAAGNPQTLALVRDPATDTWAPVTAPLPAGFALVGNDLTIANGTLEGGSDVTVTVADAAGNEADASLTGVDNTAPPAPTVAQSGGDVVVGLPNNDDARTATVEYTDAAGNPQTLELVRDPATDTWAPVTAPLPAGFALVGNDLTIANGTLEGGSDVTVTVADAAGNEADASLTGVDNTAPPAPTVAQSGGDVVVGLPNNDDARTATVEYTDAAGNPQTLALVRDPATDTWAPVTAPLPAGFALVGNDLTIANGTLEGGSDVTVTVADAAGNAADASLTGVDNTAPPAPTVAQSGGDVVVGLPNNDDARTASVEYTDAAGNPQTLELVRDPATDTWAPVTAPLPAGFTLVGDTLSIDNPQMQDGSTVTVTVADAAGNEAEVTSAALDTVAPSAPFLNAEITDQGNTISGEGAEPGATVTVRDASDNVVGTATAWTDGKFSFVTDTPVADLTEMTVTQQDAAGNVSDPSTPLGTFIDTDGDIEGNTNDPDNDGDGVLDTNEAGGFTENQVVSAGTSTTLVNTFDRTITNDADAGEVTTLTFSGANVRGHGSTMFRFAEGSSPTVGTAVGNEYAFTFNQPITDIKLFFDNMIAGGQFGNFTVTYADGTTAANLDFNVIAGNPLTAPRALGSASTTNSAFDLEKFTDVNGINYIADGTPDDGGDGIHLDPEQAAGTVSFLGLDPLKQITGISWEVLALNSGTADIGAFVTPVISYRNFEVPDSDGDTINNDVDIDSDGDRVWDEYELGELGRFRTDTDGDATLDSVEASLTAADIAALETTGAATHRVDAAGVYTNGDYSSQFILLSDAGVTLDFTQIANTAFTDVEYIDMRGGGAQTVTLTLADVLAMTDAQNTLIIAGDGADTVNASGFEQTTLQRSIEGQIFDIYALNDATLLIDADVTVVTT